MALGDAQRADSLSARKLLSCTQIAEVLAVASQAMAEGEHIIADDLVLDVVANSTLTAYDAEFVALASALDAPLVTADRAVLKAFPRRALTMEHFLI